MTIFDYVVFGLFALGLIIGLCSGFLKQLLGILGLGAVVGGTFFLYEHPKAWLAGTLTDELVLSIVAIVATALVLWIVWAVISHFITKLIRKVKVLKLIDVILGGVLGVAFVYCFAAVAIAVLQVDIELIVLVKDLIGSEFDNSWVVNTIYVSNPLGDMVAGLLGGMV